MPDRNCLLCHGIGYLMRYDSHGRTYAARCACNPEQPEKPKADKKPAKKQQYRESEGWWSK